MFRGWGKKKQDVIPVTVEEVGDLVVEEEPVEELPILPERPSEPVEGSPKSGELDVSGVFAGLEGGSGTADAVRALARKDGKDSLYMISNLKQPSNITKLRLHAEYADSVGFVKKARFLRFLAEVHCEDVVAKEGDNNRARMVKEGLNVEVNKEFEIEKRSKMGALQ